MKWESRSPTLAAAIDSLAALALAVGAVVLANRQHIFSGELAKFLLIRVTLLNTSFAIVFIILWTQCLTYLGLYHRDLHGVRRRVLRSVAACTIMTTLLAWYLQARHARGPAAQILATFFLSTLLMEIGRMILAKRWPGLQGGEPERVIIVGSGRLASKAWRELRLKHPRAKQLLGFVDDRATAFMPPDIASRFLGNVDDLPGYLLRNSVDEVIVAAPTRSCYDMSQRAVSIADAAGLRILCLRDVFKLGEEQRNRRHAALFVELAAKGHRLQTAIPVVLERAAAD